MLNNMTVRAKLILLIAVGLGALLLVMSAGIYGLKKNAESIDDIGRNRLPSILNLMQLQTSQGALRSANRVIDSIAAYPKEIGEIERQLKRKKDFWAEVDKAWKNYEALGRDAEEDALWKSFVKEWDAWKALDQKFDAMAEELVRSPEEKHEAMFAEMHKFLFNLRKEFLAAESGLDKLVELNNKAGTASVVTAEDSASRALALM